MTAGWRRAGGWSAWVYAGAALLGGGPHPRTQLALAFNAGRLHLGADLKWLDACVEELGGD